AGFLEVADYEKRDAVVSNPALSYSERGCPGRGAIRQPSGQQAWSTYLGIVEARETLPQQGGRINSYRLSSELHT
ncbi:mCG1044311, partial [Mus musculus]